VFIEVEELKILNTIERQVMNNEKNYTYAPGDISDLFFFCGHQRSGGMLRSW